MEYSVAYGHPFDRPAWSMPARVDKKFELLKMLFSDYYSLTPLL